ncbi:MAG: class II glutamine amidotransferase [Thermoplasmata archaeon]
MFIMNGNFGNDSALAYRSLREVAERDPVQVRNNASWTAHSDGWGMVSIQKNSIVYRRELTPIYRSEIPEIPTAGIIMAHVRKASQREPVGTVYSHPYESSDSRYTVFLAHNGSLNKEKIGSKLGMDSRFFTDSAMFLRYIMSEEGDIQERLQKSIGESIKNKIFGSLTNIFIIAISNADFKTDCFYYSYNPAENEYGKLYEVYGDGWSGVFSSSIIESTYFPKKTDIRECEAGILIRMKCGSQAIEIMRK